MYSKNHFELIEPDQEDAAQVLLWRNDPAVCAISKTHTAPMELATFFPHFLRVYYAASSLPPLFICQNTQRLGMLRFDPTLHGCEISIVIEASWRGKGVGQWALEAIEPWLKRQGVNSIQALVHRDNEASQKLFARAGYQKIGAETPFDRLEKWLHPSAYPLFIIAEAGSNWKVEGHDGLEMAYRLIDQAAKAGVDAVKFQYFRAATTYAPEAGVSTYLSQMGIDQDIGMLYQKLELPKEWLPKLAQRCVGQGIEFLASVFSIEDLNQVDPFVRRHKIASYEIGHLPLIKAVAKTGKPLILSTGASDLQTIDEAVETFFLSGGGSLTLLQCTAKYPAPAEAMHLSAIPALRQRYQLAIGLSDHSGPSATAAVGAVALGAAIIEKHITINRAFSGPDHAFAMETGELDSFVTALRQMEQMRGDPCKKVDPVEQELFLFAKRAIHALRDIQEGEILLLGDQIAIVRPGEKLPGLCPKHIDQVEGRKAKKEIPKGQGIQWDDFT